MLTAGAFLIYAGIRTNFSYILVSDKFRKKLCVENLFWGKSLCGKSFVEKPVRKNFPLRLSGKNYWVVKVVQKEMWTGIDCAENTLTELMTGLLYGKHFTSSFFHLDVFDLFLTFSSFSLLFLFLKLYRTIIAGVLIECYLEKSIRISAWFHLRKI